MNEGGREGGREHGGWWRERARSMRRHVGLGWGLGGYSRLESPGQALASRVKGLLGPCRSHEASTGIDTFGDDVPMSDLRCLDQRNGKKSITTPSESTVGLKHFAQQLITVVYSNPDEQEIVHALGQVKEFFFDYLRFRVTSELKKLRERDIAAMCGVCHAFS
ncbi:hypothetical protein C8J57DRAFT_1220121 [Mycena rebaudengoi]|nr:hypothetical protein C8J57DRAFT_1220121 [Mycena rebaudengoi]